jgi:hypothetical protein
MQRIKCNAATRPAPAAANPAAVNGHAVQRDDCVARIVHLLKKYLGLNVLLTSDAVSRIKLQQLVPHLQSMAMRCSVMTALPASSTSCMYWFCALISMTLAMKQAVCTTSRPSVIRQAYL